MTASIMQTMSDQDERPGTTWSERELRRLGVFMVFIMALVAAALGVVPNMVLAALGGFAGYAAVFLLDLLWGDRTRPRNHPFWWLLGIAWVVLLGFVSWDGGIRAEGRNFEIGFLVASVVALFDRHDLGIAPSLFVAGAVWVAVFVGDRWMPGTEHRLGETDAVWIAVTVLLGILAATLGHERLQRRDGAGTPVPWTILRMGFVTLWTLVIVSLREDVRWGSLFVWLGADLSGQAGQMFLIGVIVIGIVVAAFALRPGKEPPGTDG